MQTFEISCTFMNAIVICICDTGKLREICFYSISQQLQKFIRIIGILPIQRDSRLDTTDVLLLNA